MRIRITQDDLDPWEEIVDYQHSALTPGAFGATATFVGTMRDFNEGDDVRRMTLEHYPGMTERQLEEIVTDAIRQHGLLDALVVHRCGDIDPGDPIVLVAVWSEHRKAAFDACRSIMEYLKSRAPFWKKETLDDNAVRWVEKNTPA